jgi:hypothetical protein
MSRRQVNSCRLLVQNLRRNAGHVIVRLLRARRAIHHFVTFLVVRSLVLLSLSTLHCSAPMASKHNHLDDDFFGDLLTDDEETAVDQDQATSESASPTDDQHDDTEAKALSSDGLASAEAAALATQFRTMGFHQAFDEYQDAMLQEGFEAGYRENFETAKRIGHLLGSVTAKSRLPTQPSSPTQALEDSVISKLIRDAITTETDEQLTTKESVSLSELEQAVLQVIRKNRQ